MLNGEIILLIGEKRCLDFFSE